MGITGAQESTVTVYRICGSDKSGCKRDSLSFSLYELSAWEIGDIRRAAVGHIRFGENVKISRKVSAKKDLLSCGALNERFWKFNKGFFLFLILLCCGRDPWCATGSVSTTVMTRRMEHTCYSSDTRRCRSYSRQLRLSKTNTHVYGLNRRPHTLVSRWSYAVRDSKNIWRHP